jgi:hypothetical protein
MRASEILRKLADVIDSQESDSQASTEITNRPDQSDVATSQPTDTTGEEHVDVNVKPMVPPLQQKLDLLKKLAGVETEENGEECGCEDDIQAQDDGVEEPKDELATIKRNAGLSMMSQMPTILAHIADDDEPFEG